MAAPVFDSEGNRITTDILVAAYVRELGEQHTVLIPEDIICVCFSFWLIKVCDEWDKELSADGLMIDDQIMTKSRDKEMSVANAYGCHSVSTGSYTWQIKLKEPIEWFCFGIIQDDPDVLKQYENDLNFDAKHGCFLDRGGSFWHRNGRAQYCGFIRKANTIISLTLDMEMHSISYKINDKDYGIATNGLDKDAYRMVVTLGEENPCFELL